MDKKNMSQEGIYATDANPPPHPPPPSVVVRPVIRIHEYEMCTNVKTLMGCLSRFATVVVILVDGNTFL